MHTSAQFQKEIERFQFETDIIYDASITSPAEYLGYELGVEYSFHHKVMGYFELLADESEKNAFHEMARTYEGRSVNYLVITSEENHRNLEAIKADNFDLANNPEDASVGDQPIVVWMSYNVHGNEPSSSEAAMQTAYRLVASTDAETRNWLKNAIVIIDPMLNPDGHDRYVYWYKSSRANILNTNMKI